MMLHVCNSLLLPYCMLLQSQAGPWCAGAAWATHGCHHQVWRMQLLVHACAPLPCIMLRCSHLSLNLGLSVFNALTGRWAGGDIEGSPSAMVWDRVGATGYGYHECDGVSWWGPALLAAGSDEVGWLGLGGRE